MTATSPSVALSAAQVDELNRQLSTMRHDINNHLSLIMAAVELIRRKPEAVERMTASLTEQPAKVTAAMKAFSHNFEQALGIMHG